MIVAMTGLPGTGKSTLAAELAVRLPAHLLNKDKLRAALFPPEEIEYSTRQDDLVVDIMLRVADYIVRKEASRHIILDGRTFSKQTQVETLVVFGREHHWDLRFIQCTCPDDVARARLEHDAATGEHLAADRDFDLYRRIKAEAEPLLVPHLVVNTAEPLEACLSQCLHYLGS
ncbi:MAG: ATP-binding protein [Leptolinea sp.]|jgi:adenylylsulfate kinase|nr:ATP-binding protein [Leptolinea sp.]